MERNPRPSFRSITSKFFINTQGTYKRKTSTLSSVFEKAFQNYESTRSKPIPVYSPGPIPSKLLLNYINKQTPPKPSKLSQLKKSLHRRGFSLPSLNTNPSKTKN